MTKNLVLMFHERLKAARQARCMTLQQLSKASGVHLKTISSYESGQRHPNLETALILMDVLDCPMEWLFERRDANAPVEEKKLPWEV